VRVGSVSLLVSLSTLLLVYSYPFFTLLVIFVATPRNLSPSGNLPRNLSPSEKFDAFKIQKPVAFTNAAMLCPVYGSPPILAFEFVPCAHKSRLFGARRPLATLVLPSVLNAAAAKKRDLWNYQACCESWPKFDRCARPAPVRLGGPFVEISWSRMGDGSSENG
jgi:hypothetical protein